MAEDKEIVENNEELNDQAGTQETTESTEGVNSTDEMSLEEKYADVNDRFVRLYAEFDNYRKRTNKEKVDMITNASESVLKAILPTMDDFERAIANNENSTDIEAVKEGFNLIFTKMRTTLEGKGLKEMASTGEKFDSEIHEAIANVPGEETQKGIVIDTVEKGYYLGDKVIRYAKVVVGQ